MNQTKIKYLLNLISLDAYDQYKEAKEKNIILFESFLFDKSGFLYVKKNEEGNGVRISIDKSITKEEQEYVTNLVNPYFDNTQKESYILINGLNKGVISYYLENGFNILYPSYNMELRRENWIPVKDDITLIPYQNLHKDQFISLLGEAFVPIRKQLGLKPYNWYINNIEDAVKWFKESSEKGYLFGYFEQDAFLGVLEVINNDLETIAVKQSHQGKGLGRKLLNRGINMVFRDPSYQTMTLGVLGGNDKATTLYEEVGFKIVAHQVILKKTNKESV